jgi:hypothetical protein
MPAIPIGRKVLIILCGVLAGVGALCGVFYIFIFLFVLAMENGTSSEVLWRLFSLLPYGAGSVGCIVGLIVGVKVYGVLFRKSLIRA